jgi:nicotinamide-nucleotide amidase
VNACVLTIGDELLQGFTEDTNSAWLGTTLLPYGIVIKKKITVGDDIKSIINESKKIINDEYDYLFVTGGLGPTHDDITKEAFRQLLDDELVFNEQYYVHLKERFEKISIKMPKINHSQAMVLKNADIVPNDNGSALGMHYFYNGTNIFIMPGVPSEMKKMINKHIIPTYIKTEPEEHFITIKTAGIMESKLAEKVSGLMDKHSKSFRFAFLPHFNGVSFRISKMVEGNELQMVKNEFYQEMQPYSYGFNNDTLEGILGQKLIEKKLTIAVAESCTGGLIGKRLTDTAGSSDYFLGSITAYSNLLKISLLDVSKKILKENGAVSEEIALEMANGIRSKTNADIGLSTTGISGPAGGTETKPVGLAYIGLVTPNKSIVKKYNFDFGRLIHREMIATSSLNLIRLCLEK